MSDPSDANSMTILMGLATQIPVTLGNGHHNNRHNSPHPQRKMIIQAQDNPSKLL